MAMALAAVGLAGGSRRRWFILAIGVVGLVLSMGMNTPIYNLLREGIFTYRGLRVPARAAILVYVSLSVLAAWGWSRLLTGLRGSHAIATAIIAVLLLGEYFNVPPLWPIPTRPPAAARVLAREPRSVVSRS
jgi:hypothetical protein